MTDTKISTASPPGPALPAESIRHLRTFIDYLKIECGLAQNTCKAYASDLRYFLSYLTDQVSE